MRIKKYLLSLIESVLLLLSWPMEVLFSPLCWLMKIKFVPINSSAIGHLAGELDCFSKEGILGMRPACRAIVIVSGKYVANQHLLNYWKKYVLVIDMPGLGLLLWRLIYGKFTGYRIDNYFVAKNARVVRFPEIQKKYAGRPPVLVLSESDRQHGWIELQKLGVPEGAWFVCVHCREKDYSYHREINLLRNADINNYLPAIEEIVQRGGWVVRVGDSSMKAIPKMKNVIDYAHLDIKSDWMDVFLCAGCRFFLGSNSGLSLVASVFGVRCAIANAAGPFSAVLPYGPHDIGIPKLILSVTNKRYIGFKEFFSSPLSNDHRDSEYAASGIQAIENTGDEIKAIACEMLESVEGRLEYTPEDERLQERFKASMNPTNFSYGAMSRVGRDFLKKYEYLL